MDEEKETEKGVKEEKEEQGSKELYKVFHPMLTQYIIRVFFYLTQKNHLKQFTLSHCHTLAIP